MAMSMLFFDKVKAEVQGAEQEHLAECDATIPSDVLFVPYSKFPSLKYVVIVSLVLIYVGPLMYVWSKRNVAETRARSPLTTIICILLIMLDSIFNTWIFSIDSSYVKARDMDDWRHKTQMKCLLGVWVTMLLMVPILLTMYLRIYRVKRVFEVYQKYLDRMYVRSGSIYSFTTSWNKSKSALLKTNYSAASMTDKEAYRLPTNDRAFRPSETLLDGLVPNIREKPHFSGSLPMQSEASKTSRNPHESSQLSSESQERVRFQSEIYTEKYTMQSSMRSVSQNAASGAPKTNTTSKMTAVLQRSDMHSRFSNVNESQEKGESKEQSDQVSNSAAKQELVEFAVKRNDVRKESPFESRKKVMSGASTANDDQLIFTQSMELNSQQSHLRSRSPKVFKAPQILIKGSASNSSRSNFNDTAIKEEMGKLREKVLLWNAFKFVIIPMVIFSILSSYFPFMQAFVPVHESKPCICLFLMKENKEEGWYPIISAFKSPQTVIKVLIGINVSSFYSINWLFLLINILAIFRIRKMKDRLDIRREMIWAMGLWSSFDFLQYIFYFLSQYTDCQRTDGVKEFLARYSAVCSYVVIIMRDFVTHCCMLYFIMSVNRREDNIKTELSKDDSPHDLQELKTVLNSCRPLMSFSSWIEDNKQCHLYLLDYIKQFETIKEQTLDLKQVEAERQRVEEELQEVYEPHIKQSFVNRMVETLDELDQHLRQLQDSINESSSMLEELFENNYPSFILCFDEYDRIMTQRSFAQPGRRNRSSNRPSSPSFSPLPYVPVEQAQQLPHFRHDADSPLIEELKSSPESKDALIPSNKDTDEDQNTYALSLHSQKPGSNLPPSPRVQQQKRVCSAFQPRESIKQSLRETSSATATTVNEEQIHYDSIMEAQEADFQSLPILGLERAQSNQQPMTPLLRTAEASIEKTLLSASKAVEVEDVTSSQMKLNIRQDLERPQQLINTIDNVHTSEFMNLLSTESGRNHNLGFHTEYHEGNREAYGSAAPVVSTPYEMELTHDRCFQALDLVYKEQFKRSREYLTLLKEMNENIIEYRFFNHAGLSQHKKQL